MKLSKLFLLIVVAAIIVCAIFYTFNHINPWLSVFIGVGVIYLILKQNKL
jgi:energy-converting hydrogenase Eha subunit E